MDRSFRCGCCGRKKDLNDAVALSSCSCIVCVRCLKSHIEKCLSESSKAITHAAFSQIYSQGRSVQYIDFDGHLLDGVIVANAWNDEDWCKSTVSVALCVAKECIVSGIWRVIVSNPESLYNFVGLCSPATLACPSKGCQGIIPQFDIRALCPDALENWNDKAFEASALAGGFVRCPNAGCNALIERIGCGIATPPRTAIPEGSSPRTRTRVLHRERFRYRCAACGKDFCGLCLETPYHEKLTCRESMAPKCRYCEERVLNGFDLEKVKGLSTRELRRVVKETGLSCGWGIEKRDLVHVATLAGTVCGSDVCQGKLKSACTKRLACGHACCGVDGERKCLPCVESGCMSRRPDTSSISAIDDCQICWEPLKSGPCIQIACGHILHFECVRDRLKSGYPGPHISFNFLHCPMCGAGEGRRGNIQSITSEPTMGHPTLTAELSKWLKLRNEVGVLAKRRLKLTGELSKAEKLQPGGEYDGRPVDYGLAKYLYFECHKCKKPYFGGERDCRNAQGNEQEFKREDLMCGSCVALEAGKTCRVHGTDAIEWKCKYCCSVASWYCFGSTHMCDGCHRIVAMMQPKLNDCGGCIEKCPLKVAHPPAGNEFCLGCALCRHNDIS